MIIAVCRTLNEERNIERFCTEYSKIVDRIMICDGGSEDNTINLTRQFSKVVVVPFEKRVKKKDLAGNKAWRNPHGEHINFMIDWARKEGAEWIIFDDCDSVPNKYLKESGPPEFGSSLGVLKVRRLYLYKEGSYFPQLSNAGLGLWAWRANVNVRASEEDPWKHHMDIPKSAAEGLIDEPRCLLHYSFPDDEEIERKAAFYRIAKDMEMDWHPRIFGGPITTLPEWAVL
jgi:hypothetical protein